MKPEASQITRESKSNLALAFISLGRERRQDMTVFYAFCRVIDDIADESNQPADRKRARLTDWRKWIREPGAGEPQLAQEVRTLLQKYRINPAMPEEIIAGVEMDLERSRYANWEELRLYCYRVASAVGLVSIEIFGYGNPQTREYAIQLGLALQTTNIIRDVRKDLENGRIYLPGDEMAKFNYAEADLKAKTYDDRFTRLMQFQADRAHGFFDKAAALLPREDRKSMVAAEIMHSIYRALLRKIERDRFKVFERDYRLNKLEKAGRITGQLIRAL
jgi:15-cis-phytoene synthase